MGRRKKKSGKKSPNTRFANNWEFSNPREIIDEPRLNQTRENLDADGDDFGTIFISPLDFTTAPVEVEVLGRFCRGTSFEDVEGGKGLAGFQRSFWLDERNKFPSLEGGGEVRQHENPLTATGALRALVQPRFNHQKLPDAARRLIYVTDLSPASIHVLAATVSSFHARALLNAIRKHLGFQPSIAVTIPSTGCLAFQLELHLPFFILKKSTPPNKVRDNKKPDRGWSDLSFLKLDTFDFDTHPTEPNEIWSLQEAQISCVVTGTDDWRWTGYGFVDAEVDGLLAESSEIDMGFDQIAAGEMEARYPIWKPRDYWVRVFEIRIKRIKDEYENLIHKLEFVVTQYMDAHPSTLSRRPGTAQNQTIEVKVAFDWALQMMDLLRKIHDVLLPTVKAWQAFNSDDGDIKYFSEDSVTTSVMSRHRSMQNIKATFRQFNEYQEKIVALIKKCSDYQKALKLRLTLDKKEAADKNQFTNLFTVSVFISRVKL
ncbi:hypothetical protein B0O99DRAFT_29097 [Bisporella sp. PMI_857]|nr:hypothetical protein B0O99DRAFT_29097 [Bisporella sp. PMI_857]